MHFITNNNTSTIDWQNGDVRLKHLPYLLILSTNNNICLNSVCSWVEIFWNREKENFSNNCFKQQRQHRTQKGCRVLAGGSGPLSIIQSVVVVLVVSGKIVVILHGIEIKLIFVSKMRIKFIEKNTFFIIKILYERACFMQKN